jgi:hypothetical protein
MIRPRLNPWLTIALVGGYAVLVVYGIDWVAPVFEGVRHTIVYTISR